MIRLIIFDLDGTLLHTLDDLAVATNYALHSSGYPEHERSEYRFFVGNGITKLIERALPEAARREAVITRLREAFVRYYQQHKTDLTRPYPGIPELLQELHTQGRMLAVASNKYQQGTAELVRHFFGNDLFQAVLGQREGIPAKPHPAIVEEILRQTGCSCQESLYVGDSGVDMQTARNSGLVSIGVTWGFRPRTELEANGACHLIDAPQALLPLIRD